MRYLGDSKTQRVSATFEGSNAAFKPQLFITLLALIDEFLTTSQHEVHHARKLMCHRRVGARFVVDGNCSITISSTGSKKASLRPCTQACTCHWLTASTQVMW